MFFRKPSPPLPWAEKQKHYHSKTKEPHFFNNPRIKNAAFVSLFILAWVFILLFWFPPTRNDTKISKTTCDGNFSVYVYNLPPELNSGLLTNCRHLNIYTDMCPHVANFGMGQPIPDLGPPSPAARSDYPSWFATHQFIGEMIFHARVENHPCRTWDPSKATIFYVPFYGGLDASSNFRESNLTKRDSLAVRLVDFLKAQPPWKRKHGKDHFIALGRTAWDFMRSEGGPDFGANCLLNLPEVKNMSVLTVERQPWQGKNQFGIPYPSYFHPNTREEMMTWQNKVRQSNRPHLFSFIGGPRKGLEKAAIRDELIRQCSDSTNCELLLCGSNRATKCHNPGDVLGSMARTEFCLQAPGDSFTRRSTFDSVLAGCIPVFFSPHTAYTQYSWFLPGEAKEYSVFIDEKSEASKRIEEELLKIPYEEKVRMRENVINLIPRLTYAHPNASDVGFLDAVDVALSALDDHVREKMVGSLV